MAKQRFWVILSLAITIGYVSIYWPATKEYKNATLVPGQKLKIQILIKIINKERGIIIGRKCFIAHGQPQPNIRMVRGNAKVRNSDS